MDPHHGRSRLTWSISNACCARPDGHQLEALLLEPLDDLAHQPPLDPVRLDHDKSPLRLARGVRLQLEGLGHLQEIRFSKIMK